MKLNHRHPFHHVDPSIWPFFISFAILLVSLSFVDIAFCDAPTLVAEKKALWDKARIEAWIGVAEPFLRVNPDVHYFVKSYLFTLEIADIRDVQSWYHDNHYWFIRDPNFDTGTFAETFCSKINKVRLDLVGRQGLTPDQFEQRAKVYKMLYMYTTESIRIAHPDFYYAIIKHVNVGNADILYAL